MGNEENRKAGAQIGTLGGCLIDGDSEQKARERKVKRRALAVSIGLQSAALVALVVTPLLAKPEKLPSMTMFVPMPPYRAVRPKPVVERSGNPTPPRPAGVVIPTRIPTGIVTHETANPTGTTGNDEPNLNDSVPVPGVEGGSRIFEGRKGPRAPEEQDKTKRLVVNSTVQQAMLTRRVDPCFPPLARQLRRSGQVRLHAVISRDGSVESLQVMDGDPLFVQCAMEAVSQWRYRPTLLNGSPVEVETVVTVIYTLNQ